MGGTEGTDMAITLLPAYSRLAHTQDVPPEFRSRQPDGFQLIAHQVETYQALKHSDVNVVVNIAMTGDGKSLAAQLPTLIDNRPVMAMYPTNELIGDQVRQLDQARQQWGRQDLRVVRLDA